ncbi:hypothetical protein [Sedimentibacter sp. MB31-C6]|uniref:hypothetical protein n=1 Tax=Sedimentibacter sp. MB31-C6 TaxID=3109366 RepID=UPI002DDCB693|nr:hypothetical protein [Sedimentibacter sp. MB36-C1]WSI04964.1 hypothetical protein U8307_04005 [Sedimentibacter sp. MB36-C1]
MFYLRRGTNQQEEYAYCYLTSMQYLKLKNNNKNISKFFIDNNFKRIAIYGLGQFADILYNDLIKTDVQVMYFIDKECKKFTYGYNDIPVVNVNSISKEPDVDVIVITSVYHCNEAIDELLKNGKELESIINFNDVVFGMESE